MPNRNRTKRQKQKSSTKPQSRMPQPDFREEDQSLQPNVEQPYSQPQADRPQSKENRGRKGELGEPRAGHLAIPLQIILALTTIIYTFFSYHQWQAMREALHEAVRTRELENRAYVGITGANLNMPIQNTEQAIVTAAFINTGKTPAHNLVIQLNREFFQAEPITLENLSSSEKPAKGILLPNGTGNISIATQKLSEQEKVKILQGGYRLYIWGTLDYDDFFGRHNQTKFCFVNDANSVTSFGPCNHHNAID